MPQPTSIEYKEALAQATAFKYDNPIEQQVTGARIFKVNANTVKSRLRRERLRGNAPPKIQGGHNRILSTAQTNAIYKYVEDMYLNGLGATHKMVFAAIELIRATQEPPQPAPSWRWFQQFLQSHPDLFQSVTTKPIARNRVSAQDIDDVQSWFSGFSEWCIQHQIQRSWVSSRRNLRRTNYCTCVRKERMIYIFSYNITCSNIK